MILADKITEERKKNGWSQEELADKLGVSRQAVSKWESAGAVPDLQRIIQLSELFSVSTDYLLKDEIDDLLLTLTEREEQVLRLRFGLDDGSSKTLEEVGQMFGVTRERIRQIEGKALRKLKHPKRSRELINFVKEI